MLNKNKMILINKVWRVSVFLILLSTCMNSVRAENQSDPQTPLAQHLNHPQALNAKNELLRNAARFYQARHFEPLWFKGTRLTSRAQRVLGVLRHAYQEGLNVDDYEPAFKAVEEAQKTPSKILEAEIALTAYALEYIDDLYGERLTPKRVSKTLYIKEKTIDAVGLAHKKHQEDDSWKWLETLTVNHPDYQILKQALATTRLQSQTSRYPKLSTGSKLEKGSKGGRVETLQWQLSSLGFLKNQGTPGQIDSVTDQAIRRFQEENDLKVDGVVGVKTIAVLNSFSLEDRIQKLIVSMERWRWLPEELGHRYVRVNIAGFDLEAVQDGKKVLSMPVIIGRKYRKTPVFSSHIYSIRFNPSWHVPRSLAVKDKLPKIKKDPGYLSRGGYVLYDASGSSVDAQTIDWSTVSPSNFNFRIRQVPGDSNALGKIRFAIKNPFNIYLHDTNERHLFTKKYRSLSSGCVRVQNPHALAAFVFNDEHTWPISRIEQQMTGNKTSNFAIQNPVKVYITYFTAFMDDQGALKYVPDIYGQDEIIWQALNNRQSPRL